MRSNAFKINLMSANIIPLSFCMSFLDICKGMSVTTLILAGLASIPHAVIIWPNNMAKLILTTHLFDLIFML